MNREEIADRLAALPIFGAVPREEFDWLLERSITRTFGAGEIIRTAGSRIDEMYIQLAGVVAVHVRRDGGWRKVMESGVGYVLGVVPYTRMNKAPGNLVAEAETTFLALHEDHFRGLVTECPAVTAALVRRMIDRARDFRTMQMEDERMVALGKLASGLAHELNNPASGASSGARMLVSLLDDAGTSARALAAAGLDRAQLDAIDAIRTQCTASATERSPLEAADREDDFSEWLDRHGLDPAVAVTLASSDVSLDALDTLADALSPATLGVAITWVASDLAAREVAERIQSATTRIHDLVAAVKGFTFMDREGVPEDVDIVRGLTHTVAMLESKARAKSANVRIETPDDLPRVYGYGSELNQVWERLIDNAIDAVARDGNVMITATARGDSVVVRIADDGPGIPEEIQSRIFDPFFTTKPAGMGTGLSLEQARRLVHTHHGDIDFTSKPGRTVFRVRLPMTGAMTTAEPRTPDADE